MTDKKEQIFLAVIEHVKQEGLLAKIKVAEIAKYADMGKGTIYEYFDSKEEIISETIIYMIDNIIDEIKNDLNHELDFETSLKLYIKKVTEIIIKNMPFHNLLMTQNVTGLINQNLINKIKKKVFELRSKHQMDLQMILDVGFNEGKFKRMEDEFIINAISNTIFSSIVYYINSDNDANFESLDDSINKVYDLILKMLS